MAYLVEQIKDIVNDSVKDALGKNYDISKIDSTDFVSMGKALSQYSAYEGWFSALANRIVKTVYFIRTYEGDRRSILRDEHEYGAFIQKVYYEMPDAVDNPTWKIPDGNGDYKQHSPYDVETTIPVSSLIFGGKGTWSIEFIRPIVQIKSAFLDVASMGAFIDGLYLSAENSFKLEEERLVADAVNTAIASSLDGGIARNLLGEYNAKNSTSYTAEEAITVPDFLRFASKEINRTIDNMGKMSTVFNKAGYNTFTSRENMVVEMLAEFASASDTYLQSDTFHKELVALPNYEKVPFWQTSGRTFAFKDCSKISIEHDDLSADVTQGGIICFVHDVENVAAYFGARRSWEMPNPRDEIMIHGEKAEKGFAVDNHANAEVFYLATGGTVSLADISHGSATLSDTHAYRGNTIIATVTPSEGYHVKSAKVGDVNLVKVDTNVYAYDATDANATITIVMEADA